jgi:DNA-binding NarL/FixJ family response regulator
MRLPSEPGMQPIRVIVADANLMACGLVSAGLKRHSQFKVVGHATSAHQLLQLINDTAPEVALISSTLQDGIFSGLSVLAEIHSKYPEMRLVLLIDGSEPEVVVQAFRAGARGVFSRSEGHFEGLCKCIIRVHEGQIWAKTQQLQFIVNALAQAPTLRVVNADGANLLTKREEDLVHLVADGLGNRDIARQLNLSENTVKNYMFHIFDKLGVSNRVELVLYALTNRKCAEMSTSSDHAPQLVAAHVSALSPENKVG